MSIERTPEDTARFHRDMARIGGTREDHFACPKCGHDFCGLASELAEALQELRASAIDAYFKLPMRKHNEATIKKIRADIDNAEAALEKAGITEAPEQSPYR